jgi:signal transduction histidine kinase
MTDAPPMTTQDCDAPPPPSTKIPLRAFLKLFWSQPLWAIPFALFFGTIFGRSLAGYIEAFKVSLVFSGTIGLGLWIVRWIVQPRAVAAAARRGQTLRWQFGLLYGGTAFVASIVAAVIVNSTVVPGFMNTTRGFVLNALFSLVFVALFVGINFAFVFYRQAAERARTVESVRAELAQAELRALRAQINPHFLFNTLNTIASLIRQDPEGAEDVTTRLAELFRYALRGSRSNSAPLRDELEFLRHYLAIEHARFGSRLRVEESIAPGLDAVEVPSLLLQPLVENAVRYAVADRIEGGRVTISVRPEGDVLVLEVADDGPGIDPSAPPSGNGFGLHSVRERLRAAGPPHALELLSEPGHGTVVRVTVPLAATPLPSPELS